jgi:hypothetical protein
MTVMRYEMTTNRDGTPITLRLYGDETSEEILTTILDTAQGTEIRTTITHATGETHVVQDKVDRATPPLELMMTALQNLFMPFATNSQAVLNEMRYKRLVREGKPITVQNMCMDGHHTGEQFADKPFHGGIVGVPEVDAGELMRASDVSDVSDDFLNRLWGDEDDQEAVA